MYIGSEDNNIYCLDALTGKQIWNFTTIGWVDSSPAVGNGHVFVGCSVVDGNQDDLPSSVYCLDASTGEKIWNYTTVGGVSYSSPAIAGGLVFVGDWANNVYCLNASTGAEKWTYSTGAHINSSPAIAGGIVYITSWDHHIYAFGDLQAQSSSASKSFEQLVLPIAFIIAVIVIAAIMIMVRRRGR